MARTSDGSGRRGPAPRNPRREPQDPSRPVPPAPAPPQRSPDDSGPRGGDPVGVPRGPVIDGPRPGVPYGPGETNLPPVPPNPNPNDNIDYGGQNGNPTYHSAAGEPPVYDDSQYLDAGPVPYTEPAPTEPQPQPRYTPRYSATQMTGGPEFRSSGTGQQLAENDRLMSQHQGNVLEQDYVNALNYQQGQAENYGQQADEAYAPLLRGEGGYTPEEADRIRNSAGMEGLQLTPDQIDAMQLQQHEQDAIKGDPYRTMAYYNPEVQRSVQMEGGKRRVEAAGKLESDLNSAIDPSKLSVREGYGSDLTGAVDTAEGQISDYLDPSQLNASQEYLDSQKMSPEERQGYATAAGMDVRDRYTSQIDEMGRKARAEGVNAAGAAAMAERSNRIAASEAGDAMTKARLAASAEAARRADTAENTRLRYGQNLAGMQTNAALDVAGQRRAALTEGERARLGAEQDIAGRRASAATTVGNANLDVADRNATTALENERTLMNTAMNAQQAVDDRSADRARTVAENRQATTRYGQATRYGQGMDINQAQSARNTQVANARRQDSQEGRAYVTGRQTQANQGVQAGLNRRGDLYATQSGAATRNTGNKVQAEGTPGKGERILGGVLGAASGVAGAALRGGKAKGGIITEPTYAIVGEDGPEAIVPLTGEDPEVLPGIAMQYGQSPFNVAPPPTRKAPAYGRQLRYAS